jgi:hypothetical protein
LSGVTFSNGSICRMTVDGTDFRFQEPIPFDPGWYSHKFKCACLRYEIGICIQTGEIALLINGPFPCGAWLTSESRGTISYIW